MKLALPACAVTIALLLSPVAAFAKAKKPANTNTDSGRTLADYNIQKESIALPRIRIRLR